MMNSKLSIAIAAVLGALSGARSLAATAEGGSDALEEITVTAQRRAQSMQEVPISMQAFTGQALQQLNIQTFDDYIKYLPNVTSANNGPGQNEVFMRGLSAGSQASQGSGSTGVWPSVAIYLDNQSGQLPNTDLTAVLNLPLIANTMAVRAVIYNDKRGGYIDNVPATFTRKNTDVGIHYAGYPANVNG